MNKGFIALVVVGILLVMLVVISRKQYEAKQERLRYEFYNFGDYDNLSQEEVEALARLIMN